MNETRITVHGNVVNDPVERTDRNGNVFITFRIGTTPYRKTADGKFLDLETSFLGVIAFNALVANAAASLKKGQPVIVEGNFSNRSYVSSEGVSRNSPEIEADHIGHDLTFGRASFARVSRAAALGLDRTSDVDVRNAMAELNGALGRVPGPAEYGEDRPRNVDANGEVIGDFAAEHGEATAEAGAEAAAAGAFPGDPRSDDYTVEHPAA